MLGPELTTAHVLPAVIKLSEDPVPNVRFNVAKALRKIHPYCTPAAIQARARAQQRPPCPPCPPAGRKR